MRIRAGLCTRQTIALGWDLVDDAQGYDIRRTTLGDDDAQMEWVGMIRGPFFVDCALAPDTAYEYYVEAMGVPDENGTVSARTQPELQYPDPISFFEEFLSPTFGRNLTKVGEATWCEEWWRHPEAQFAVQSLWEAFEDHRPTDPPAIPNSARQEWLTYFLYPTMDRLLKGAGPFIGCHVNATEHVSPMKAQPLPHHVDPTGLYQPGD